MICQPSDNLIWHNYPISPHTLFSSCTWQFVTKIRLFLSMKKCSRLLKLQISCL